MRRKSAPKVRGGRVQKKNNWTLTPGYAQTTLPAPVVDRERPGAGYRHLLKRRDIDAFISILPEWNELAVGLDAIVLAKGDDAMGWHETGVVAICAWESELWWDDADRNFLQDHADILERLGVLLVEENDRVSARWTESQARAFQLLHILLHELGHHHDRITTRSKQESARGEPYAEAYARRHEEQIWAAYVAEFGLE